jgi:hypothetical protein
MFNLFLDTGAPYTDSKSRRTHYEHMGKRLRRAIDLAAPQGFEPR